MLRPLLLRDLRNNRLRKRYLDARPAALWEEDLRYAHPRVAAAGGATVLLGFVLLGAAGGLIGTALLARDSAPAAQGRSLVALATGGMFCGAAVFGLLGALGHVVLADLVGEERAEEAARPGSRAGAVVKGLVEATGGALWGAAWGLLIGLVGGFLVALGGADAGAGAGALGGAVVGIATAGLRVALALSRGPGGAAHEWAWLGPLPLLAYGLPLRRARKRYLR